MNPRLLLTFGTVALLASTAWADTPAPEVLQRADSGDAAACFAAAEAYLSGPKAARDYESGARYARKTVEANAALPGARALYALLLHQGRGIPMDRAQAGQLIAAGVAANDPAAKELAAELKKRGHLNGILALAAPEPDLLRKAEEGDAGAQWQLANAYAAGWIEYPKGSNPGREWRERAAEGGVAEAQRFLAEAYLQEAYGYPKDIDRGLRWLRRAAEQGDPRALARIGEIYFDGKIVPRDDTQAVQYLKRAVNEKVKEAETLYGILLVEGRGTAADPAQGGNLLIGAEQRGDLKARRYLFNAGMKGIFSPVDPAQMQRLLEQGVKDGNLKAKAALGVRLYTGDGLTKDIKRAAPLLEAAAEGGDFVATQAYLDYLNNRLTEMSNATGPGAERQRTDMLNYIIRYKEAMLLYGRNGKTENRREAAHALTRFAGPEDKEMRELLAPRLDKTVVGSLALIRIYRQEGGKDAAALGWLDKVEKHLREIGWENEVGQTAAQMIDQRQREFEKFIATQQP